MQQVNGVTVKMEAENETGSERPLVDIARNSIKAVLELKMPCEESEDEFLCDECVFNIVPNDDCGLHKIHERAMKLRKEIVK